MKQAAHGQSAPSTLVLAPQGARTNRRAGRMTQWLAGAMTVAATLLSAILWAVAGWTEGEAGALLASLLLLGMMGLHIADHIADFLGRAA